MPIKPAIDTLRDLRNGDLLDDLSLDLHEVIAACDDTGKKGQVTITLSVNPDPQTGTVVITDTIKTKVPEDVKATLFHVTTEKNLSLRNPRQPDIPNLEPVDSGRSIEQVETQPKTVEK